MLWEVIRVDGLGVLELPLKTPGGSQVIKNHLSEFGRRFESDHTS